MSILLCNDDGVQSDGLHSLRDGLIAAGHRVLTVAPSHPRSGSSRGATFRNPVLIEQVGGDMTNPVYACDGTPTDCVRVAMLSDLANDAELVLSGINEGANLGDDSTYSSTMGSALEGALLGLPAIAASQQSVDGLFRLVDATGYDWSLGVRATVNVVEQVLTSGMPARTAINLNAPGRPAVDVRAEVTRLGRRNWARNSLQIETHGNSRGYFTFGVTHDGDAPYVAEEGTDFDALRRGHIALSAVSVNWNNPGAVVELEKWLGQAADSLTEAVRPDAP
ncbi:5'/3'-nucleotidase SurE [Kineococcus rhizosphaerae]|uniref:5'-nucleotidase SurE n=1 Tax=Kineococcus rhizosphaerae TaxID=559628 RepID=A0A2T0QUT8_9ACTN|nr:5'/3'-nucleotidase SurE [Kineococcus rhizosphaerae]PRY08934.1 5'-nucleotidase /3'-nucleotidase /exopolyphosphatase [Kineococcus rhizosphaerae]